MKGTYIGKAPGSKLIRVSLEWEEGIIKHISIRGDFFAHPEEGFDAAEAALNGQALASIGTLFKKELEKRAVELFGLDPMDLETAIKSILSKN